MSDNIERTLGRILATQEFIVKQLVEHNTKLDKHIEDDDRVEERVDSLEKAKAYVLGIVATISVVIPLTMDLLLTKVGLK